MGRTSKPNKEQEKELLENKIKNLEKMLSELMKNQKVEYEIPDINQKAEETDDSDIRPNKYIKVMSLNFGKLVLSTEGMGKGKIFTFNKFGEVKNIVYSELANIIHHQQSFAERGKFYIFDKKVVENHGLTEYYNKFLTKEKIENILDSSRDDIVFLFRNATDFQKDTIVQLLVKRIIDGEKLDMFALDVVSREYGKNIYDIAKDKIESIEVMKEEENTVN